MSSGPLGPTFSTTNFCFRSGSLILDYKIVMIQKTNTNVEETQRTLINIIQTNAAALGATKITFHAPQVIYGK